MASTIQHVLAAADYLAADLAAEAAETWAKGLDAPRLARLERAGVLDPYRDLGGDATATVHLELPRLLARNCASTAWVAAAAGQASACLSAFPDQARAEVREAGDDAQAGFAAFGDLTLDAVVDPSSGRARGTWKMVPAAATAPWFLLVTSVPAPCCILVTRAEVGITPFDHQGGLRGAGFGDVMLTDVLVLPHRRLQLSPSATGQLAQRSRLMPVGVAMGCAEGAFRDYVAIPRKRVNTTGGAAVAKFTQVQIRLAQVDAELASARGLFDALTRSCVGPNVAALARDGAFIVRQCLRATTQLVQQMGAQGIAEANAVQRHARDLRAVTADPRVAWDAALAAQGRAILGISDPATL